MALNAFLLALPVELAFCGMLFCWRYRWHWHFVACLSVGVTSGTGMALNAFPLAVTVTLAWRGMPFGWQY